MDVKTIKERAAAIRDEQRAMQNTASRVGGVLVDMADVVEHATEGTEELVKEIKDAIDSGKIGEGVTTAYIEQKVGEKAKVLKDEVDRNTQSYNANMAAIQQAMQSLPDGQAVSAQVAKNTTKLSELEEKINGSAKNYKEDVALIKSGTADKETTAEGWCVSEFIPYTTGKSVIWNYGAISGTKTYRLSTYNADKVYIDGFTANSLDGERTISKSASELVNCAYIRVSFQKNLIADGIIVVTMGNETWTPKEEKKGLTNKIDEINESLENVINEFNVRKTYRPTSLVQGSILNGNLTSTSGTLNNVSDTKYYEVVGDTIIVDAAYLIRFSFYDKNEKFIGSEGYTNSLTQSVPDGAKYVRFSFKRADSSNFTPSDVNIEAIEYKFEGRLSLVDALEKLSSIEVNGGASTVVERNADKTSMLISSCRNRYLSESFKDLQICICTDVHSDTLAMKNAIAVTDGFDTIDALVCLGDQEGSNYAGGWYNTFNTLVGDAKKPVFAIAGNHDCGNSKDISICATHEQVYNAYIKFMEDKGVFANGEHAIGRNYYYHDFAKYGVRMIFMYEYDDNLDVDASDSSKYRIQRGTRVLSKTQAQWFLNTLLSTPSNYAVVVAMHNPFSNNVTNQTSFRFADKTETNGTREAQNLMLTDFFANAIDAFRNGDNYVEKIVFKGDASYLNTLSDGVVNYAYEVSADFRNKNIGADFLVYIGGHVHGDIIWKHDTYNQWQVSPICAKTAMSGFKSDLMRTSADGLCKDALTIVSFDKENRKVRLVKIGANVTQQGDKRDIEVIDLN